jgi:hypothetical protein
MNISTRRQFQIATALLAGSLLLCVVPALAETKIKLEPPDGKAVTEPTPLTFGVVFRPGEIPKGQTVDAKLDGVIIPVQFDAKRHYVDGSIKHGVLSLVVPKLDAAAMLELAPAALPAIELPTASVLAKKLLATDFDATVSFTFPAKGATQPDGSVTTVQCKPVTASARKMLEAAGEKAVTWLNGPVAYEWLLSGPPVDADGKADPDLAVQFQVRYYRATGQTRVSAVVEKCSDAGSDGGVIYDVTFTKGKAKPEVVFEQKDVHHPDLTRYRKVFWLGKEPAAVVVKHDAKELAAAGVVPQYDFSLQVPAGEIDKQYAAWQGAKKGLFENGFITKYMGMTGGRADIGPLTGWEALYVYTMDPREKEIVLGNDELSGGIPIHVRSTTTGRVPSWEERPMLWLDERAGNWGTVKFRPKAAPQRATEIKEIKPEEATKLKEGQYDVKMDGDKKTYWITVPIQSIFQPEAAHHPCLGYVSYVVTGDSFFLDEAYFWACYLVFADNPGYSKSTLCTGQLRGQAWSMRTVSLTAAIAPDNDPEKTHLSAEIKRTLDRYMAEMNGPDAMPLGTLGIVPAKGEAKYAPWQHDYMIMAIDCAVNAGFKDAEKLRSRMLDFSVGRFTNAPDFDPKNGAGYWWILADKDKGLDVKTWKDLATAPGVPAGHWEDYAGGYCDLALAAAAIGIRTGNPKAKAAYDYLVANTKNVLPSRPSNPCFAFSTEGVK